MTHCKLSLSFSLDASVKNAQKEDILFENGEKPKLTRKDFNDVDICCSVSAVSNLCSHFSAPLQNRKKFGDTNPHSSNLYKLFDSSDDVTTWITNYNFKLNFERRFLVELQYT